MNELQSMMISGGVLPRRSQIEAIRMCFQNHRSDGLTLKFQGEKNDVVLTYNFRKSDIDTEIFLMHE